MSDILFSSLLIQIYSIPTPAGAHKTAYGCMECVGGGSKVRCGVGGGGSNGLSDTKSGII